MRIGEHDPCFTAAYFDVTGAIHWGAPNEVVIRIGAHPGVLPANVSQGTDFEKNRWTPGIYDDVKLMAMDNPVISQVQAAPQLATSSVLVQTELHNYSDHAITTKSRNRSFEWKSAQQRLAQSRSEGDLARRRNEDRDANRPAPQGSPVDPRRSVPLPGRRPNDGDQSRRASACASSASTPRPSAPISTARPYFLRGSNITLHRFFEDPESGTLPWDEKPGCIACWSRFRSRCTGTLSASASARCPIAGLRLRTRTGCSSRTNTWSGPAIPVGQAASTRNYDTKEMIGEYSEWMRDNWNHPSVAIWDATNESWLPQFTSTSFPRCAGWISRIARGRTATTRLPDRTIRSKIISICFMDMAMADEPTAPGSRDVPGDRSRIDDGPRTKRVNQQERARHDPE